MLRKAAIILVFALIMTSVFVSAPVSVNAVDDYAIDTYDKNTLLNDYSTAEIVAMYPEAAAHIAAQIRALNTDISLRDYDLDEDHLGALYFSVMCENPDIFYVLPNRVETTSNVSTRKLVSIRPEYLFELSEIPAKISEFQANANYILSGVDREWDDVLKARYIHDMLAQYVEYDTKYTEISDENAEVFKRQMRIYTSYGALVDFNAVCEGYSMAYKYLLEQLGIKAYYVQSNTARHSWLMVKLGDNYYHIDLSHDDPTEDTLGRVNHTYFLKSDRFFKADGDYGHTDWITNIKADDTSYDNMWWNSVSTIIYRYGDYDYYVNQRYSSSVYSAVTRRDASTGEQDVLTVKKTRWMVQGVENAHWEWAYTYITCDGYYFYFNDTDSVYRQPIGSDTAQVVYTKPASQTYDIYGLAFKMDGNLYITIKPSPNDKDFIIKPDLTIPSVVPTTPTEPPTETSATTPTQPVTAATEPATKATEAPAQPTTRATEPSVTTLKQTVTLYVNYATTISVVGGKNLKFTTSNKTIATVNSKGKITAKKAGKATVTIKGTGVVVKITVKVKNPYLAKTKVTLKKGKTYTLKVRKGSGLVTFKSSNKKIATVSYKGKIKAVKKGKTTIIVKVVGIKLKCTVVVK